MTKMHHGESLKKKVFKVSYLLTDLKIPQDKSFFGWGQKYRPFESNGNSCLLKIMEGV